MQTYVVVLPSASRTTTQTNLLNVGTEIGLIAVLNMTVVGTGSVTLAINGVDSHSGATWNILTGAAVVTNSTNIYRIFPSFLSVANSVAGDVLPATLQFVVTANNANAAVYSLTVNLL